MLLLVLITIGVLITALLHVWFFILETFLWQKPLGLKTFKLDPAFAKRSAPLAANQGIYNAFLAAGLIWSLWSAAPFAMHLKVFFLSCIVLAGIYGAITVSRKILFIQAIPAGLTLILTIIAFISA